MKIDKNSVKVNQYSEHSNMALGWNDVEGNRYHVWFDRVTRTRRNDKLYKNPALSTPYQGKGYFHTRHLDVSAKTNMEAYTLALQIANDGKLFDRAEEKVAAKRVEEQRKNQKAALIHRIKEHGVELLEALEEMLGTFSVRCLSQQVAVEKAFKAIENAKG